ncbi:MAG: helix-hairpin-helix domain-containing protein [Planctomycetota bacterium]
MPDPPLGCTNPAPRGPCPGACWAWMLILLGLQAAWLIGAWHEPHTATPPPAGLALQLNPNTATAAELALLPRIGPKLAADIVACREAAGVQPAFACAADLDRVPRIGPLTVAAIQPFLRFPPPEPGSALPAPGAVDAAQPAPVTPAKMARHASTEGYDKADEEAP